jgi:putative PIN family toxin of toxin-antitoxin system
MTRVVLDTNVLVSALIKPGGAPARILDLVLSGQVDCVIDDRILAEYRDVLARPRLGLEPDDVNAVLMYLTTSSDWLIEAPASSMELPDPDDRPFVEVAAASGAILVTGNLRHFPATSLKNTTVRVCSPAQFLAMQPDS